jgi:hypothetical protein
LLLAFGPKELLSDLWLTSPFGYYIIVAGITASVMISWLLTDDMREPAA